MPRGDRTGPRGAGPMTGRSAGWCAGFGAPGFAVPAPGRGPGYGMGYGGGGHGWRHMYYATGLPAWARGPYAPQPPLEELPVLKAQARWLGEQLAGINERIEELEGKQSE